MTEHEGNYLPERWAPFIYFPEPKAILPSTTLAVAVGEPKKPLGFAPWPEDPKPEWRKA